jgi:L-alanine-DL-glutamate epimerase-like enolase superfamily enzyme
VLITDVVTKLVEFPFGEPFHPAWARGRNMAALQMVLIQVETDEGITGIGATHAGRRCM